MEYDKEIENIMQGYREYTDGIKDEAGKMDKIAEAIKNYDETISHLNPDRIPEDAEFKSGLEAKKEKLETEAEELLEDLQKIAGGEEDRKVNWKKPKIAEELLKKICKNEANKTIPKLTQEKIKLEECKRKKVIELKRKELDILDHDYDDKNVKHILDLYKEKDEILKEIQLIENSIKTSDEYINELKDLFKEEVFVDKTKYDARGFEIKDKPEVVMQEEPVEEKETPASEQAAPVSRQTVPVYQGHTAPVSRQTAPVYQGQTAPVSRQTVPVSRQTAPVYQGHTAPVSKIVASKDGFFEIYREGDKFSGSLYGIDRSIMELIKSNMIKRNWNDINENENKMSEISKLAEDDNINLGILCALVRNKQQFENYINFCAGRKYDSSLIPSIEYKLRGLSKREYAVSREDQLTLYKQAKLTKKAFKGLEDKEGNPLCKIEIGRLESLGFSARIFFSNLREKFNNIFPEIEEQPMLEEGQPQKEVEEEGQPQEPTLRSKIKSHIPPLNKGLEKKENQEKPNEER